MPKLSNNDIEQLKAFIQDGFKELKQDISQLDSKTEQVKLEVKQLDTKIEGLDQKPG